MNTLKSRFEWYTSFFIWSFFIINLSFVTACSEAPQQISNSTSSSDTTAYSLQNTSNNQPATISGDEQPVPEEIQKLEKEHEEKPSDTKVKEKLVGAKLKYGNSLMNDPALPPRVKYRAALKMYREVLQLDPNNAEAQQSKNMIETIYKQMGRPIPS